MSKLPLPDGYLCKECGNMAPETWGDVCRKCQRQIEQSNQLAELAKSQIRATAGIVEELKKAKDQSARIDQLTADLAESKRQVSGLENALLKTPVPELEGAIPIVLYFGTHKEADEFLEMVKEAKPHMVERKL